MLMQTGVLTALTVKKIEFQKSKTSANVVTVSGVKE